MSGVPLWGILGLLGAAVFGVTYHYSKRFLDWLRFQSIGTRDFVVEKLSLMFIEVSAGNVLIAMFAMSVGLGGLVFVSILPQVAPAIFFGCVVTFAGWKAPKPIVDWLYQRRVRKFTLQMVDALGLMSNGMRSGLSIVQSMGLVTQELPNPVQQEFSLVLSQNKLGVPLEEAFTNLSKRVVSDDVEMFVTAINILKETGGNLAETFDTIVVTIRERIKVEQKIQALTAQGLYQGMFVIAVPPVLGFVFYETDPEMMMPLFTTTIGWMIVAAVLALEVVGYFLIMKFVKIDV